MRRQFMGLLIALLTAACGSGAADDASLSPSSTDSPSTAPARSMSAGPSETPVPTATALRTEAPTPQPSGLAVGRMATVVADSVVVRTEPGRQSAFVVMPCTGHGGPCPNALVGPNTGYESVFLMDGPVQADGYGWYLAAAAAPGSIFPEFVGWIPAGDSAGPWVVPADTACPDEPIVLEDVTYAAISRLELLACVGGRELTLRGWYPAGPSGAGSVVCEPLSGREAFCGFGYDILRPVEAAWAGDATHLPWIGETAAGLSAPPRDAWITIRGRFDHPAAADCYDGEPYSVITCRYDFVVSSIAED